MLQRYSELFFGQALTYYGTSDLESDDEFDSWKIQVELINPQFRQPIGLYLHWTENLDSEDEF